MQLLSGQQIHALVMSLNYTGIEIKTAHSLESWSGGVIVMVSGSVQSKDNHRRKFMQTFFLAPQENNNNEPTNQELRDAWKTNLDMFYDMSSCVSV
jgi:hypothetical protein